jgi:hypothetical protein
MEYAEAKRWATASVVNSVLLPASAALQFDKTFWALVVTNFVLMHMVWIDQLLRSGTWQKVDLRPFKWPLVAFALLGISSVVLWGHRLATVFSS